MDNCMPKVGNYYNLIKYGWQRRRVVLWSNICSRVPIKLYTTPITMTKPTFYVSL